MKRLIKATEDIYGMAQVGMIDEYEVFVNTNDGGNIPHFHFRNAKDWRKFHTCICIDKPEYFHHTGKEDVLNSLMKRKLEEFMRSPVVLSRYKDKFKNNWEVVCFMWDINNSSMMLSEDLTQPDYRML